MTPAATRRSFELIMGIYGRLILPRLIDLVMRGDEPTRLRQIVAAAARGDVLEIGIGSGLNLPFYGAAVRSVIGVDPSPELLAMAARRAVRRPFPVELVQNTAERLPFADARFDTAVSTWSLCSIPDPRAALAEVRRVLKPGGLLLFIEHGLAPETQVRRWQAWLTPLWRPLAGGCHLDRKVDDLVVEAGFDLYALDAFYSGGLRVAAYTYRGSGAPARAHDPEQVA